MRFFICVLPITKNRSYGLQRTNAAGFSASLVLNCGFVQEIFVSGGVSGSGKCRSLMARAQMHVLRNFLLFIIIVPITNPNVPSTLWTGSPAPADRGFSLLKFSINRRLFSGNPDQVCAFDIHSMSRTAEIMRKILARIIAKIFYRVFYLVIITQIQESCHNPFFRVNLRSMKGYSLGKDSKGLNM